MTTLKIEFKQVIDKLSETLLQNKKKKKEGLQYNSIVLYLFRIYEALSQSRTLGEKKEGKKDE